MTAKILDGKAMAADILREVRAATDAFEHRGRRRPGLAVVKVGEDPASAVYVRNKRKTIETVVRTSSRSTPVHVEAASLTAGPSSPRQCLLCVTDETAW